MSIYAVNDKSIIVAWKDGASVRWEQVGTLKSVEDPSGLAAALKGFSKQLWRRAEYLGEKERLVAVVKAALRRNGSDQPNRRRAKIEPAPWEKCTTELLSRELEAVDRQLANAADLARSAVRVEVLAELDAAYVWASGGRDQQGRCGQLPLHTDRRFHVRELHAALTATRLQAAPVPLRGLTSATYELIMCSAASATDPSLALVSCATMSNTGQQPQGFYDRFDRSLVTAVALVRNGMDPVTVARSHTNDERALRAGLVDASTMGWFKGLRAGIVDYETLAKKLTGLREAMYEHHSRDGNQAGQCNDSAVVAHCGPFVAALGACKGKASAAA